LKRACQNILKQKTNQDDLYIPVAEILGFSDPNRLERIEHQRICLKSQPIKQEKMVQDLNEAKNMDALI